MIECAICHDSWKRGDQSIEWYIKWLCTEREAAYIAHEHMDFFHDGNVAIQQEIREVKEDPDLATVEYDPAITYQNTHYRKFYITEQLPQAWLALTA